MRSPSRLRVLGVQASSLKMVKDEDDDRSKGEPEEEDDDDDKPLSQKVRRTSQKGGQSSQGEGEGRVEPVKGGGTGAGQEGLAVVAQPIPTAVADAPATPKQPTVKEATPIKPKRTAAQAGLSGTARPGPKPKQTSPPR